MTETATAAIHVPVNYRVLFLLFYRYEGQNESYITSHDKNFKDVGSTKILNQGRH